jgi:hypothetical protein
MSAHIVMWSVLGVIAVFAISTYVRVITSPAYRQKPDEITTREPGQRRLGAPQPLCQEARKDLDFALLSQAAYQEKGDAREEKSGSLVDSVALLQQNGWIRWADFPDAELHKKISKFHLRVEIWSNLERKAVAVTFGGTVFTNITDWEANLRWFIPRHQDEYTIVVTTFGRDFVTDYLQRSNRPEFSFLREADIFSTGHSLGGGLAQEFAYALPENSSVPRVKKVFAFDPSPVTGFYSIGKKRRDHNTKNLAIDRIYERGEILAILRSLTSFFHAPSAMSPTIRQVRYDLFRTWNPIAGHSIAELACKLCEACNESPQQSVQRDRIAS